jgi:hypothetical protein
VKGTINLDYCPLCRLIYDPMQSPSERPTPRALQHRILQRKRSGRQGVFEFRMRHPVRMMCAGFARLLLARTGSRRPCALASKSMLKVPEALDFLALALACSLKMSYYDRALVAQCLPGLV